MKATTSIIKTSRKKLIFAVSFSALLLTASPLMAEDKILATVNGQNVTESQLEIAAAQSKVNFKEIGYP